MGFMAGFGPAFAESFNSGMERRAKKKDDMFKLTYNEFLTRREKYEEQKSEDSKRIRAAKTYARDFAGDEKLWPKMYEWLSSGLNGDDIQELIAGGEFEMASPSAELPSTPEPAQTEDAQMMDAGLSSPSVTNSPSGDPTSVAGATQATGPAPQAPINPLESQAGFMDKMLPGMAAKRDARRIGEVEQQVMDITKSSREDFDKIMRSDFNSPVMQAAKIKYTKKKTPEPDKFNTLEEALLEQMHAMDSGDPGRIDIADRRVKILKSAEAFKAQKKAESEGLITRDAPVNVFGPNGYETTVRANQDDNGQWIDSITGQPVQGKVMPVSKEEYDAVQAVTKEVDKPFEEYRKSQNATISALDKAANMNELVEMTNGAVLADITAGAFSGAQKWIQEIAVGANYVTKTASDGGELDPKNKAWLQQQEKRLQDLLGTAGNDLATAKGLFEVQKALLAYDIASMKGQEGRSLSEPERKVFMDAVGQGTTVDKFRQNLGLILTGSVNEVDLMGSSLQQHPSIRAFGDYWGYTPKHFETTPMDESLSTNSNTKIQRAWQIFRDSAKINTSPSGAVEINGYKIRKKN
jgi:hypothetical protein